MGASILPNTSTPPPPNLPLSRAVELNKENQLNFINNQIIVFFICIIIIIIISYTLNLNVKYTVDKKKS